jgi:hypothetical protein
MALVQEWVDSISRDVPEPITGTVARFVQIAIQEFFRKSEAWRITEVATIAPKTNVLTSDDLPPNSYIKAIDWAYFTPANGSREKMTVVLLQNMEESKGRSNCIALGKDSMSFAFDGDVGGKIEVGYIVQPNRSITEVPDLIADQWFEAIRVGALGRLLDMADRPWTNHNSAVINLDRFERSAQEAKREARRDRSRPRRVAKFNPGFAW